MTLLKTYRPAVDTVDSHVRSALGAYDEVRRTSALCAGVPRLAAGQRLAGMVQLLWRVQGTGESELARPDRAPNPVQSRALARSVVLYRPAGGQRVANASRRIGGTIGTGARDTDPPRGATRPPTPHLPAAVV